MRLSALACLLGFGGFLLWAGFAPLDEGITASGQLIVEDDRKTVQHFEGGIIRALFAKEGQLVEKGDVLLELEPLQSEAARDEVAQELGVQIATLARLTALREGEGPVRIVFAPTLALDPATAEEIIERQTALFEEQRAARMSREDLIASRRATLEGRARDLGGQIEAARAALGNAREELVLRRSLVEERLETIGNLARIEREVSALAADLSRLEGERNAAKAGLAELENEAAEAEARFSQEIGQQIVEAQARALAAKERLKGVDDRLSRTVLRAPQSGEVLNLAFTTVGGVVGPGEPIMEIVPDRGALIASIRLSPTDRDAVSPGQTVEAQLTAYKSFVAPRLDGEVRGVSADLIEDPATGTSYYEARIALDAGGLSPASGVEMMPGMPVDAFIRSGRSRTLLDYVFEPIMSTMSRGARMG